MEIQVDAKYNYIGVIANKENIYESFTWKYSHEISKGLDFWASDKYYHAANATLK